MQYMFLLEGFISAWACTRVLGIHSMSIMGCFLFLMTSVFIYYVRNNCASSFTKRNHIIITALSFVLTVLYIISEYLTILSDLSNKLFKLIILVITFVGLFIIIFYIASFILWLVAQKKTLKTATTGHPKLYKFFPFITFGCCMIMWLPWFLYSYPGIMTPDSINQVEQIVGLVPASNHHPYVHTLTIRFFYNIGLHITGSPNGGVAAYVIFQMLFLSASTAFLVKTIQDYQPVPNLVLPAILTGFYALIPYNAVMSITVWKDAFFAGVTLLFCTLMFRILAGTNKPILYYCLFCVSSLAFCLYRTNGFYAFVMLTPFLLIALIKKNKILSASPIVVIALVLLIKGPVMNSVGIEQPDFVESLCIPVQQIARVLVDDREISDDERELIEKVIDTTYIHELYASDFADNIKELVRAGDENYLTEHKKDYAKLYVRMALEYPDEYYYAYIDQTYGYYDPISVYTVADVEGIIGNDIGIYSDPIISSHILLKLREILIKLQNIVPVYGSMWSIGCMLWYALILLAMSLAETDNEPAPSTKSGRSLHFSKWVPFIPPLAIIATLMIATPVATEFRYAYALFYCIPLLIFIAIEYNRVGGGD